MGIVVTQICIRDEDLLSGHHVYSNSSRAPTFGSSRPYLAVLQHQVSKDVSNLSILACYYLGELRVW